MNKDFTKNNIGLSDEYSKIFASIYGEQEGSSQFSAYEENNSSYSNEYDEDFVCLETDRRNDTASDIISTNNSDNDVLDFPDKFNDYVNQATFRYKKQNYDQSQDIYHHEENINGYNYVNLNNKRHNFDSTDENTEYISNSDDNLENSYNNSIDYVNEFADENQAAELEESNSDSKADNIYTDDENNRGAYNYVNQNLPEGSESDISYSDSGSDYYDEENYFEEKKGSGFSSFFNYLSSRLTGLIFTIRGGVSASSTAATMYEDDDDLGREVTPKYACNYYGQYIYSLGFRVKISTFLIFVLLYFSLSLPLPGSIKNPEVLVVCILALQFTIMLLCLDVFTTGLINLFAGNCGADSLSAVSCIFTTVDALMVISDQAVFHIPLCALSSLSLFGVLYSSFLTTRGIRKALRVPTIGHKRYCVTCEQGVVGQGITVLKSTRSIIGFVRRTEEEPIDEHIFKKFAPLILILSAIFTLIIVLKDGFSSKFLYIFTLFFTPAVPFTALLCFALPYYHGSKRIFSYGAAIAGYSGAIDLGHSKNLIVTDRDLFPDDCIEIGDVRIFADYDSKKVISYAASMIKESDSSLVGSFEKLLNENECDFSPVDNFEVQQGGGFKALIEGHVVLCGNVDLMRLMDIKVPFRLVTSTSVLLSIDGVLYGIFNLNYKADDDVRKALVGLMHSNRHPVFATRDFNVTPDMIKEIFDVATDGYDFPPYADRFPISMAKPSHDSKISAVICREGLGSLTAMADAGRSIYVVSKVNTILSIASAVFAPIFVFILAVTGKNLGTIPLFLYTLFTSIPVVVLGIIAKVPN